MQTESTTLGDIVRLLRVRSNQVENSGQEAERQQQENTDRLQQRMEVYQQENREAKEAINKRVDLLDLRLQQVEERTENWSSVQQQLGVLQSEVTMMKSTQT